MAWTGGPMTACLFELCNFPKDKELTMEANLYENDRIPELPQRTKVSARKVRAAWLVPAVLILLSLCPLTFGAVRLNELASGAEITPGNARFFASPLPVVIRILGAAIYAILGAMQFVSRLWRRGTG